MTVSAKLNWMAYSELPWRPFLGHQAWSWTTQRRGNVFCYVYKRLKKFVTFFLLFKTFYVYLNVLHLCCYHWRWQQRAQAKAGGAEPPNRNLPYLNHWMIFCKACVQYRGLERGGFSVRVQKKNEPLQREIGQTDNKLTTSRLLQCTSAANFKIKLNVLSKNGDFKSFAFLVGS